MKKIRVVLISAAAAAITLTGCMNVSGGEYYVTLPPAPIANGDSPTVSGIAADSIVTTPPVSEAPESETLGGTTIVAVELDSDGNIVTDKNGAPVTTIISEKSPTESGDGKENETAVGTKMQTQRSSRFFPAVWKLPLRAARATAGIKYRQAE